jgi:hypothetical protein
MEIQDDFAVVRHGGDEPNSYVPVATLKTKVMLPPFKDGVEKSESEEKRENSGHPTQIENIMLGPDPKGQGTITSDPISPIAV